MHAKRPQDFTIANPERQFFLLTGVWFLALTVLGFSRSFFFRADYHGPLETPYLLHGFAFTSWLVIYLVQVGLITAGRIKWHMILGKLGAIVLIGVLVTGFYVVLLDTSGTSPPFTNA
jgi:hypothetical protein